jgi:uncharacterized protein YggE
MKNSIAIFLFSIFTISAFSQTTSGNEISAEGSARTKVKPDLANFRITVVKENLVEKTAIKELNEEIEKLQKVLFSIGFTDRNIKIADYQILSNENSDDKKEYSVTNSLSINFALDNKLIDAFYQQIQSENMKDLDVTFETQMSEELQKTTRQKLVQMAVLDAKSNAENIAKALDVKINNVKQVSKYNLRDLAVSAMKMDQVRFNKPMVAMAASAKTSFDKFEVEEKELEETITIVYEIVKK